MRIEIAGALSCGKSTLAGELELLGHRIIREDLSTNPYLDLRVADPDTYDLPCQRQFVLDKIASLEAADALGLPHVCDFSIAAERAYVTHYSAGRAAWIDPLFELMDRCEADLGLPDLLIHLRCAPEEQMNRIRIRGRDFEQGHDLAFVAGINRLVDRHVEDLRERGADIVEYWTDRAEWRDILSDLDRHHLGRIGYAVASAAA